MFRATQAIYDELKDRFGKLLTVEESEGMSRVSIPVTIDGSQKYRINYVSFNDNNDVQVYTSGLPKLTPEGKAKVLPVLNDLNERYRHVKFVCNREDVITLVYDFLVGGSDPARSAFDIGQTFFQILEKAYPVIMKALWT